MASTLLVTLKVQVLYCTTFTKVICHTAVDCIFDSFGERTLLVREITAFLEGFFFKEISLVFVKWTVLENAFPEG